ncbi:S-layer homology domain-containing protein [Propioniciclava soli]|uniref:S-layer homology domain-containing protein n=1 Tax=Propioniciclava soli TaxID=2775081 RepID=A0ABZ3C914_9ACTN
MRVAIQGDIGQPVYHVGDEAMVHGALDKLGARGVTDVVLLTRDLDHTRRHFGPGVDVARTLVFPWPPVDRERYLAEIKAVMAGQPDVLPAHDQVFGVIETLRGVDALFIAGGGNMNSRYGWLLYERAAMAHIAVALGKQVVIGGQTLGPELSDADRSTLANLLRNASLVGLREDASLRLARELTPDHPGLRPCFDDASELPDPPVPVPERRPAPLAATFAAPEGVERDAAARAYARLLDAAARRVGAPVLFVPHMATPGEGDGDEAFHAEIAAHLTVGHELAPVASALESAAVAARARGVLTSRYHPVVFALSDGVSVLAVVPDEYGRVRIEGAFGRVGREPAVIGLDDLIAAPTVRSSWLAPLERSATPAPHLATVHAQWWDDVAHALGSDHGRRRKLARHWLRSRRQDARRLYRRLRGGGSQDGPPAPALFVSVRGTNPFEKASPMQRSLPGLAAGLVTVSLLTVVPAPPATAATRISPMAAASTVASGAAASLLSDGVILTDYRVECVGTRAVVTLAFVNVTGADAAGSYALTAPDALPADQVAVDVPVTDDPAEPTVVTATAPRGAFRVWDTSNPSEHFYTPSLYGRDCAAGFGFSDLYDGLQFSTEMDWTAWAGISTGYPDGTYRPFEPVERGAMAAFLHRLSGSPDVTLPATPTFTDVPRSHPFFREIEWMASTGVTTGYGDGTYRPDAPVNRDAMAAFFSRLSERSGFDGYPARDVSPFGDVTPDTQFYAEMAWMYDAGISTGYPDRTYRPVTPVLRDAMAAFMYRYVDLVTPPA